jgi:uncharacterized membrane protein YheB (UPF0754 family)
MSVFKEDFTEEFINDIIDKSIKETLVISNKQSIYLVKEKIKAKLQQELIERERRAKLKAQSEVIPIVNIPGYPKYL